MTQTFRHEGRAASDTLRREQKESRPFTNSSNPATTPESPAGHYVVRMNGAEETQTLCGECGLVLDGPSNHPIDDRTPCPDCGSTTRKVRVLLKSSITATSTVEARLSQVVPVKPARENETAMPIGIVQGSASGLPVKDLPAEFIAECLSAHVNILEPDENGQWPVEVGAFGVVGRLVVGSLDDAILEVAEWLRDLAERWKHKLDEGE